MASTMETSNINHGDTTSYSHEELILYQDDPFSEDCNITSPLEQSSLIMIRPLLQALLGFFSLFLNTTIIIVVCRTKRLHTVTYVFIVSMAVSDLIIACVMASVKSFVVSSLLNHRPCALAIPVSCVSSFLTVFSIVSNIGNHLMISVERWLYIAAPFLHQRMITRRLTIFCLISVWGLSLLINFNLIVDGCGVKAFTTGVNIGIVCPVFHFALSFLMFLIYSHIAYITYCHAKCILKPKPSCLSTRIDGAYKIRTMVTTKWKSIRMLVFVFGTFFFLVTPSICADVYAYAMDNDFYDTIAGKIMDFVWSTHCFLNFFIYAVRDGVFRNAMKLLLVKTRFFPCVKQVQPMNSAVLYCKTIHVSNT